MRAYETVRHVSTLDTDLVVHKVPYRGPKYLKVRGSIICRRTGYVYETATYKIQREHLKNWSVVL